MATRNYFELLGLPARYAVDGALLDRNYHRLQNEIHPDRHVAATPAEQLHAVQLAAEINTAYRSLKSPADRACHLLELRGIDPLEASNTVMPAAFLIQQMEWREALESAQAARDGAAAERLLGDLRQAAAQIENGLRVTLDEQRDDTAAAEAVRKLRFLDKVRDEIERTLETLET